MISYWLVMISVKRFFFACLIFVLLFLFGFNLYFQNRVIANVHVFGKSVSGMRQELLRNFVISSIDDFEQRIIVLHINKGDGTSHNVETTVVALGISLDADKTMKEVFGIGRQGDFGLDALTRLSSIFEKREVLAISHIDFSKLSSVVDGLAGDDVMSPIETAIVFAGETKIVDGQDGLVVDKTKLAHDLRVAVQSLSTVPIEVEIIPESPKVSPENATKALEKVKLLNNQRIVLNFDYNSWKISGVTLIKSLRFFPKGMNDGYLAKFGLGDSDVFLVNLKLDEPAPVELDVGINDSYIRKYVGEIASAVNQNKVDATLVFEGGKVKQFSPAQDGQKLDEETTFKLIKSAVSVENLSAERDLVINLPVKVVQAKIANDQINSLGIRELVGRGISFFSGSIANRIYNITLGAGRINGTLVKSGETFSFNKTVGDVSGATGYKQAYVISSGRTVLDDGGGICQVSTTIFRAALAAGLPVTARTSHAYRVGYYEQGGFKPGMDATVWAPAVDFAFKNDTDHYLLVQTVVDPAAAKLEVDIYGTRDGRVVDLSNPVVTNITPAPPDKFQDDPTLPKGVKKQVDFAAKGATSVFKRKVYKGDQVLIDESFKSVYRPWQAVYLVGTGG